MQIKILFLKMQFFSKRKALLNVLKSIADFLLLIINKVKSLLLSNFVKISNTILVKKYIPNYSFFIINFISIVLLIFFSPVYSIMWLVLFSFIFLYVRNYKFIYRSWFITITIWYLIFTTTLAEIPILVGFENTKIILIYLIQNDVLFANLCFQTVVLLDILSSKLGFPIYIPAFINIIKPIINFFKPGSPTACGPEKSPDSSQQEPKKQSWLGGFNFWKPAPTRGDTAITDSEQCLELAKQLKQTESAVKGHFHTSCKTNGVRTAEQVSVNVPYFDYFSFCFGRQATKEERKQYNQDKKNSK